MNIGFKVKNRHGPEIERVRVKWAVNEGVIEEDENQPEEEDVWK